MYRAQMRVALALWPFLIFYTWESGVILAQKSGNKHWSVISGRGLLEGDQMKTYDTKKSQPIMPHAPNKYFYVSKSNWICKQKSLM